MIDFSKALPFLGLLFAELEREKISWEDDWRIDHLCYRVTSESDYEVFKKKLALEHTLLAETLVNQRMISTFRLKEPILFGKHQIDLLELPSPRPQRQEVEGFEHFEVVTTQSFDEVSLLFQKFKSSLAVKDLNSELKIQLSSGVIKFHALPLDRVIELETLNTQELPRGLQSNRLLFKARDLDQTFEAFQLVQNNLNHLEPWMPWAESTRSTKDTETFLREMKRAWASRKIFDYSVFLLSSQSMIGSFGVHSIDWRNKKAELGYWLDQHQQGKAYIHEAIELFLPLLKQASLTEVLITCDRNNIKSQKVAERAGFALKSIEIKPHKTTGAIRETCVFSRILS